MNGRIDILNEIHLRIEQAKRVMLNKGVDDTPSLLALVPLNRKYELLAARDIQQYVTITNGEPSHIFGIEMVFAQNTDRVRVLYDPIEGGAS